MTLPEEKQTSNTYSHDLVILGDLHLGEGVYPEEQRYSPTEDFFSDLPFSRFLAKLHEKYADNPSSVVLVLNGDTFDFLTVTKYPSDEEAAKRGFHVSPSEKKFGLNPTAPKSVYKLDVIFEGHEPFFIALAKFLAAGHHVEIIRGNHDLELHFEVVRNRLLEILVRIEGGPDMQTAETGLAFHEWFYIEPGRVYIEHGNQYDSMNSIRYPLHPILSGKRWWTTEKEKGATLDYPLGSIFVRFFYNRVRRLDPYTPRMVSFEQYIAFVRRYNIFDIWRVYRDHYPHFAQALGPATITGSSKSSEEDDKRQDADFKRLEAKTEYGTLYKPLNDLKILPTSASKSAVVKEIARPVVRRAMWFALIAFAAIFLWLTIFQLIDKVPWLTANVFLMSFFMVVSVGGVFWAWSHLQRKLNRRRNPVTHYYAQQAQKLARLTKVNIVVMGHTHMVDCRKINEKKTTFVNSGTWTSVDNPWNRIMRDARRLTFSHIKGDKIELCRWNDDAGRFDPVPLFYLEDKMDTSSEPIPDIAGGEHSWLPSTAVNLEDDFESEGEDVAPRDFPA